MQLPCETESLKKLEQEFSGERRKDDSVKAQRHIPIADGYLYVNDRSTWL